MEHPLTALSCRICLQACSNENVDMALLSHVYRTVIGFEIGLEDIPKKLCRSCLDRLGEGLGFLQLCIITETKLAASALCSPESLRVIAQKAVANLTPEEFKRRARKVTKKVGPRILKIKKRATTTGLERFKCQLCPIECSKASALKSHIFRVHECPIVKCQFCPKELKAYVVAKHVRQFHKKSSMLLKIMNKEQELK